MIKKLLLIIAFLLYFNNLILPQNKNINFFGFIHSRINYSNSSNLLNFQINKARFGLNSNITKKLGLFAVTELGKVSPNKSYSASLLDAYVWYNYNELIKIRLGRDWYKFGWEYSQPIPTLPFINFAESISNILDTMGRNGYYGYDTGLWIFGQGKIFNIPMGYNFSITNGGGLNNEEDNKFKDLSIRLYFRPFQKIHIGGSFFRGYSLINNDNLREYISNVEFRYIGEKLTIGSEYIFSDYGGNEVIKKKKKSGFYVYFNYKLFRQLNVLARIESTSSLFVENENINFYTIGITYSIKKLNNIKINYLWNNAKISNLPNSLIIQFQIFFI